MISTGKRDQSIPTNSKLLLVELSGGFGDSTVGTVMQQLEGKKRSYVAFYTSSRSSDVASNSRVSSPWSQQAVCTTWVGGGGGGGGPSWLVWLVEGSG